MFRPKLFSGDPSHFFALEGRTASRFKKRKMFVYARRDRFYRKKKQLILKQVIFRLRHFLQFRKLRVIRSFNKLLRRVRRKRFFFRRRLKR